MCITVSKGLLVKVTWAGTEESGETRREAPGEGTLRAGGSANANFLGQR